MNEPTGTFFVNAEAAWTLTMLSIIYIAAIDLRRDPLVRLAAVMASTYLLVGAALFVLPRSTYAHHWIIGTPFQYCVVALALPAFNDLAKKKVRYASLYRLVLVATIAGMLATRLPNLVAVENSLIKGQAAPGFDPAFNRLPEIASRRSADSLFIAADWGTGTQLYCGLDGQDNAVEEPFWNGDPVRTALETAERTQKHDVYVVRSGLSQPFTVISGKILDAFEASAEWQEVPLDEVFAKGLGPIEVHKFRRRAV